MATNARSALQDIGNDARDQLAAALQKVQDQSVQRHPQVLGQRPIDGINAEMVNRIRQLTHAVKGMGGDLYVFSGERDHAKQQEMFEAATRRYGSEAEAKKHVSLPGQSSHHKDFGLSKGLGEGALGVDVRGDLHLAHRLAPQFGLVFPNANVPWHMEFAGLDKLK